MAACCGCAGPAAPAVPPTPNDAAASCPTAAKGAPTQFKHTALATIDGPIFCDEGAFIRVHGRAPGRKIEMGHPAAEIGCRSQPSASDACPVIFADAFGEHVMKLLIARGIPAQGVGLGACGTVASPSYDGWHFSVSVDDWKRRRGGRRDPGGARSLGDRRPLRAVDSAHPLRRCALRACVPSLTARPVHPRSRGWYSSC
jgi:hypothetical protein